MSERGGILNLCQVSSAISHRGPRLLKELRSDNVFLFQGMHEKVAVILRIFTPRSARQKLEQTVEDFFKDPFIDRFLEEGKQQGMQQGRADSATRVLLTILAARGIAIPEQARARIAECTDPDQLESWATRAATSTTADEVFAF